MSRMTALTPALRSRLEAVAGRIRLLRSARGLSLVALVLLLGGAAALLADYLLTLPTTIRLTLFAGWLALGTATLLAKLVFPLLRRLDPADLAAVVEQQYPQLAERLTTSVELAGTQDELHGSPALIALLVSDTAQQTAHLDFLAAVSARRTIATVVAAATLFVLLLSPAVVWPQATVNLGQRFFCAWITPAKSVPYKLDVPTGNVLTARGQPVVFRVRVQPHYETAPLPKSSVLVLLDAEGQEKRLPMVADRNDSFSLEHKVTHNGSYRVEAGDAVSETYEIKAIVPVELAEDSPIITIAPPTYARETILGESFKGIVDLSALKHSDVKFDLHFTRPAVAAHVEWTVNEIVEAPEGNKAVPRTVTLPLPLSEDRRSATWVLSALASGSYRLVLEAEHGIRTELDARTLTVRSDQPPQVVKFAGKEELQAILAYDRLPLEIMVGDDVGVACVDLEYTVNNGALKTEALALAGANRQETTAKHVFQLAGKVQEGDDVSYRLRIQDNLPEEYGGPNTIYYPTGRWLSLKIARKATPLREQEIVAQRDDLAKRLEAIRTDLQREQRGIYKMRQESRDIPALTSDQMKDLEKLRQANRATENALHELAREANAVPALERMAGKAQAIADREMRQGDVALRNASSKKQAAEREAELQNADKSLTSALQKLDELEKTNEKLAQARLDQQKLEALADREKQLASRAAELAAKDPVRDPMAKQETESVKRAQAEVAAELQRLSEQSETLRNALKGASAEQAKMLAEQAKGLAKAQRELADKPNDAQQPAHQQDLLRQTKQLAQDLSKLGQQMNRTPQAASSAQQAAQTAQRAQKAMQEVRDQQLQDNQAATRQAQQQAAQALDQAAQQATQAAQQQAASQSGDPMQGKSQPAGQAVRQAQNQLEEAQNKLTGGQAQGAQAAMQKAAQSLQQAAQQMAAQQTAPPTQMGRPNDFGAVGEGRPDPSVFGPDMQKYAGKTWGELPGEMRTKIVQDMEAKYGDDYARMIKLYFEQIADSKRK
jgi:hypothetical protein